MAKVKMTEETMTKEEADFLAEQKAKRATSTSTLPKMSQLAINLDPVDKDGNDAPIGSFFIRDEAGYSRAVTFRPLRCVTKYMKIGKVKGQWKTENESIFVEGFDTAYDAKGGVACGRVVGQLPAEWTESQKKDNMNKATCYAFLFGLVTLPGKEPQLVNFRASPAKAKAVRDAIRTVPKAEEIFYYNFNMKLVPVSGTIHPNLEMVADFNNKLTRIADIIEPMKQVDTFIEEHNKRIMSYRDRQSVKADAKEVYKDVSGSLADDFEDSDGVPF